MKRLRNQLKCHTFEWFLKNIYQSLPDPKMQDLGSGEVSENAKNFSI